ncbi:DNA-binding MarR family transcriptional regulator [Actinoplanes octamycinicus]|uniref:DNA-binding MarR family transcriptional regulator n=1 Tax=Actinoplanes octamycinicus TaxID=135948 RepID=A0A7W7H5F2_9ACTN|nr:helix-turn-helix domain-containing protein [Actinoplanes octamycinicus]MBB4744264.1 DNA-binding MarR family transcriptional regulator [Actinoplanes octamycinicus]GIE56778.1 transcriptional regulator [Actinoplanes octamycinicus]
MTDEREPRVLDVDALKALAHTLRQQMLTRLQQRGPATSAELAAEFGADRGATSYHLRQLARFGFIEEDTERSAGRRRYWRSVPADLRLPQQSDDPETAAAAAEVGRQWFERGIREQRDFLDNRDRLGEFGAAALHSYGGLRLTADELLQFGEAYVAFLKSWQRPPGQESPGSRHVTVLFHAFPGAAS